MDHKSPPASQLNGKWNRYAFSLAMTQSFVELNRKWGCSHNWVVYQTSHAFSLHGFEYTVFFLTTPFLLGYFQWTYQNSIPMWPLQENALAHSVKSFDFAPFCTFCISIIMFITVHCNDWLAYLSPL